MQGQVDLKTCTVSLESIGAWVAAARGTTQAGLRAPAYSQPGRSVTGQGSATLPSVPQPPGRDGLVARRQLRPQLKQDTRINIIK